MASGKAEIYSNLNLVLRRKPSRACKKGQGELVWTMLKADRMKRLLKEVRAPP